MSLQNKTIKYSIYNVCTAELYLSDSVDVNSSEELFEKIALKHNLIYLQLFTYRYKDVTVDACNTLYLMIDQ